ncbi:hypothetical protein JCM19037_3685 [Geomicrobium sp. JCM 19037]|uniref:hypothetical protein n=1 Tax=unclassified Geomicrobium TaxID=2628951 RepID=UPI00045F18E3|nr:MULTISPECIES: hypothetical protein [unclassified Geomicrobium]GAK05207.1 hypothetical protein JCM19037_3685 [Geomicrobium sp. JCM 19037]GAK11375.1 hypothetical protein JCM19039_1067 [Geomicrobium sp. JCM 19039]
MNKRLKYTLQGSLSHFVIAFLVTFFFDDEINWSFVISITLGGTVYWGLVHPILSDRRASKSQ